jgi:Uncharacterized protein conserved in bacteria
MKEAGEPSLSYNDAVEEALCFGWIDSTIKHLDEKHRIQHFTPRKPKSPYSRPNIERLRLMDKEGKLHPRIKAEVQDLINAPYVFPPDIIEALKADPDVYQNYIGFPEPYRRIRVAYIDAARRRPEEFFRRLNSFIARTRANKIIQGFGGIDKYYGFENPQTPQ